ncbi:MAG: 2-oxo acid dehydrogenase subunit E2 [Atribacterota bacterium]|nr:2-oxo acid dehydrogenase subunit E2 [Atribacterota bacterium]
MAKKVIMPKLGLTMEEGVINRWLVKEGDRVERGDILFEVATDKVNMEVESPASGVVLKILYPDGATVPITQTVAYIGEPGETVGKEVVEEEIKTSERLAQEPVREVTQGVSEEKGERIKASPLARRLAAEYGIDLSRVEGTGPGGRIVKEDVERAKQHREETGARTQAEKEIPIVPKRETTVVSHPGERMPLSRMRKIIAQRLTESFQTKPHFFVRQEVLAEELIRVRERLLPLVEKQTNLRISYTDLLVKMVAKALEKYPLLNAYLVGEEIVFNPNINIGVAVALEEGLVVPVVKNANTKGLAQITQELHALAEKAKSGRLTPEEISGGTFTISNLGMFGTDSFTAIINPPESAILACGAIKKKPVVRNDEVVISSLMELTLSCDHRLIDGAVAAQFMQYLKSLLEEPFALIL